jgi:hypothetical protein
VTRPRDALPDDLGAERQSTPVISSAV